MSTHQYVQHDWSPTSFALVLLAAAVLVVVGMGIFLIGANREQRGNTARHAQGEKHGPIAH